MNRTTALIWTAIVALAVLSIAYGHVWAGTLVSLAACVHAGSGLIAMLILAVNEDALYLGRPWWLAYVYRLSITVLILLTAGAAWWWTTSAWMLGALFWALDRELADGPSQEPAAPPQ